MSMRKPTPPSRTLRPCAESLEMRQLLSSNAAKFTAAVSGVDPDGASWTLRLYGPGTLSVIGTDGQVFTSGTKGLVDSILTITVAGATTDRTRLVGTVYPNPENGNARVYFENLNVGSTGELGKIDLLQVSNFRQVQNGIHAIDMPDFYLAHTETTAPASPVGSPIHSPIHTNAATAGSIIIPQGVNTLRFGGVDVNYTPQGGTPLNQTGQSNEFAIVLGLPLTQGTSIIVNSVNSNAQANTAAAGDPPFQEFATFQVAGRLNLFQANEITGNTTTSLLPTQLVNTPPINGPEPGGTMVVSEGGTVQEETIGGAPTGQIGDIRIGGDATNFTALVTEDPINAIAAEGQLDAKIANFFIGGQTQNVLLIAPSGSRNISFGLGMDNVTINSLAISSLRANRDATDSNVTVSRSIGNLLIGGDVSNTSVNVGESQSLFSDVAFPGSVITGAAFFGAFYGDPPPIVANHLVNPLSGLIEPYAQSGGSIKARIAGNIYNSVFTASVDAFPAPQDASQIPGALLMNNLGQTVGKNYSILNVGGATGLAQFGAEYNVVLPRGVINAKVEGSIDNSNNPDSTLTPPLPKVDVSSGLVPLSKAFFAQVVHRKTGPIIPPTVPYEPYKAPTTYTNGQSALHALIKIDHYPSIVRKERLGARKK